jgi:hypothetical protein
VIITFSYYTRGHVISIKVSYILESADQIPWRHIFTEVLFDFPQQKDEYWGITLHYTTTTPTHRKKTGTL